MNESVLSDPAAVHDVFERSTLSVNCLEHLLPIFPKDKFPEDIVGFVRVLLLCSTDDLRSSKLVVSIHPAIYPTVLPVINSAVETGLCLGLDKVHLHLGIMRLF